MGGEDHGGAFRHFGGLLDEDDTALLEGAHHMRVVHDLLTHVDGGPVLFEGLFDGVDGAVHPGAVTAGFGEENTAAIRRSHAPILRSIPASAGFWAREGA